MAVSAEYIKKVMDVATLMETVSLDAPVRTGEETPDTTFADFVEDPDGNTIHDDLYMCQRNDRLNMLLIAHLQKKMAIVMLLRYGYINGRVYTLNEIGQFLGCTRERVRQLEAKGIQKMRRILIKDKTFDWRNGTR